MFDRFDICEAYYVFALHWHASGLCMHPTSGREINVRLGCVQFKPALDLDEDKLTENGREILAQLEALEQAGTKTPVPAWVNHLRAFHQLAE